MSLNLNILLAQASQAQNAQQAFGYEPLKVSAKPSQPTSRPVSPPPLAERKIVVLTGAAKTDPQFRLDLFAALSAGNEANVAYLNELRTALGLNAKGEAVGEKTLTGRDIKVLIERAQVKAAEHTGAGIDALYSYVPMDANAKALLTAYAAKHMEEATVRDFLANADKGGAARSRALAKLVTAALADPDCARTREAALARSYLNGVVSAIRLLYDGVAQDKKVDAPAPKKPAETWAESAAAEFARPNPALLAELTNARVPHLDRLPEKFQSGSGKPLAPDKLKELEQHWTEFQEELKRSAQLRQRLADLYDYTHGSEKVADERIARLTGNVIFNAFCEFVTSRETPLPPPCPPLAPLTQTLQQDAEIGLLKETAEEVLKHKAHAQSPNGQRCQMVATINALLNVSWGPEVLRAPLTKVTIDVPDPQDTSKTLAKEGYRLGADLVVLDEEIAQFETDHPDFPKPLSHFEKMLTLAVLKTHPESFDPVSKTSTLEDIPPLFGLSVNATIGSSTLYAGTQGGEKTPHEAKAELRQIARLLDASGENLGVVLEVPGHFTAVTSVYYNSETDFGVVCLETTGAKPTYKSVNLCGKSDFCIYGIGKPRSETQDNAVVHPWTLGND